MNRKLAHVVVAIAAAAGGWFCGASAPHELSTPVTGRSVVVAAAKLSGRPAAAWAAQLPDVRAVPGASSETEWIKWAMAIPDADIPAAISRLNTKTDFHALRYLYARWTKLNPAAAWASFRRSDIPAEVRHFFMPDLGESRGMAGGKLQTNPRQLIAARMLASWLTVDSAAARAYAAKLADKSSPEAKDVPIHSYHLKEALGEGLKQNTASPEQLAATATEALTRESGRERTNEIASALQKWMAADTAAAGAWLRSLSREDRRELWRYSFRGNLRSVPAAERTATHLAMLEAQGMTSQSLAASQNPAQGTYARYQWQNLHDTSEALRDWITQDTAAARQWLAAQPDSDLKSLLAGEAAAALGRTDVNAAIALLNQTGGDQQFALRAFVNGWAERDARACLQWAGKIPDAATRESCMESAALSLAASDPAMALSTAGNLNDAAARQKVFTAVRQSLSWNPAALEKMKAQFPGEDWKETPRR